MRSVLSVQWKDWCWSWNSNTLATWCKELTHLKRPWCWERLRAGGEGNNRRWDGWMASLTQWTWVWVNSGSWWWKGRPGMPQSMGSQRVGHDWATELNLTEHSDKTRSGGPTLDLIARNLDLLCLEEHSRAPYIGRPPWSWPLRTTSCIQRQDKARHENTVKILYIFSFFLIFTASTSTLPFPPPAHSAQQKDRCLDSLRKAACEGPPSKLSFHSTSAGPQHLSFLTPNSLSETGWAPEPIFQCHRTHSSTAEAEEIKNPLSELCLLMRIYIPILPNSCLRPLFSAFFFLLCQLCYF